MRLTARAFIAFVAACAAAGASPLGEAEQEERAKGGGYVVERMNGGKPIIHAGHFAALGTPDEGRNINGPSLIRVPDWLPPEARAHPDAVYYLYFADHGGVYLRMAWAADLEGPWTLYGTGADVPAGRRGVLDLGAGRGIALGNGIAIHNHVASPDVHVDDENERIVMYFHAPARVNGARSPMGQETFAATSADGLNFNPPELGGQAGHGIRPVMLGRFYFRVFAHAGSLYAIGNFGRLYRARDAQAPWSPPPDFDSAGYLWEEGPNPFREAHLAAGFEELYPRHFAVRIVEGRLHAFYSRIGDTPERIVLSTIDLEADWRDWAPSFPPHEVLRAELPWEGAAYPPEASRRGRVYGEVNQLRDPCLFEDVDGRLYLLYSGQGEDAIGIARLRHAGEDAAL